MPEEIDDFEIKVEPKDDEDSFYVKTDGISKKAEELGVKLDKLLDRLKLISLEMDKKSADLEIKIGKLEEKFKDTVLDFPKLKTKTDEIENLLHVVNLGLADFKKQLSEIDSRTSGLEEIPTNLEKRIVGMENKIKKMDDDIQKAFLRLGEIETIKKDVTKSLEGALETKLSDLNKGITDNRAEIEHMKKGLDAVSMAIKSFGRTVELTNIDDIIKRFDAVDGRVMNLEMAFQKLRATTRESTVTEGDVEAFMDKLKEVSTTVMNTLNRMNKLEMTVNDKLAAVEEASKDFKRIDTLRSVTEDVREQVKIMQQVHDSVQDLYGKIMRIYDSGKLGWDRLQNISRDLSELEKLKTDLQDLRRIVEWVVNKEEKRLI